MLWYSACCGTKPTFMFKISLLKNKFIKENTTEFPVGMHATPKVFFDINDRKKVVMPLVIKPNYRYLKTRRDNRHAHNF